MMTSVLNDLHVSWKSKGYFRHYVRPSLWSLSKRHLIISLNFLNTLKEKNLHNLLVVMYEICN